MGAEGSLQKKRSARSASLVFLTPDMFFKEIPLGFTRFQIVRQRHPASDYAQKAMAQAFANQTN